MRIEEGSATLSNTEVVSNSASDTAGGVFVGHGSATLSGTRVVGNLASSGGGTYVRLSDGVLNTNGGRIEDNSASALGGGVFLWCAARRLTGRKWWAIGLPLIVAVCVPVSGHIAWLKQSTFRPN